MADRYVFYEDRVTKVRERLRKKLDGGAWANHDVSSASAVLYFRAFESASEVMIMDEEMTKPGGGSDGVVAHDAKFASSHDRVVCRVVESNENTVDANTPSGYEEEVWLEFEATVHGSPSS